MAAEISVCIFIINLFAVGIFGLDKIKARNNKWRISEKTLLLSAALAPLGALIAIKCFAHKTRNLKFQILVPIFLIVHVVIFVMYFN